MKKVSKHGDLIWVNCWLSSAKKVAASAERVKGHVCRGLVGGVVQRHFVSLTRLWVNKVPQLEPT